VHEGALDVLAGLLRARLEAAEHDHGVAGVHELVRHDLELVPVLGRLGQKLPNRVLALVGARVGNAWTVRILPTDVVVEALHGALEVTSAEGLVAGAKRVDVLTHSFPPSRSCRSDGAATPA